MNQSTDPGRVGRRALVRTGVWAVPAVSLAVAAPAMAVSGGTGGKLRFTNVAIYAAGYSNKHDRRLSGNLMVLNEWTSGGYTATGLTLILALPDTHFSGSAPASYSGSGWAYASSSHSGSSWLYTFLWTGSAGPGTPGSQLQFAFDVDPVGSGDVQLVATASATGATGDSQVSNSVTLR